MRAVGNLLGLRRTLSARAMHREVDRAEGELRAAVARLRDLVQHAQTRAQIDALSQRIVQTGFRTPESAPQFHDTSSLVGWRFTFDRP
jgi:hypothetical protein